MTLLVDSFAPAGSHAVTICRNEAKRSDSQQTDGDELELQCHCQHWATLHPRIAYASIRIPLFASFCADKL